jgi:transcriptional regulator GlxA family with amidase domain
LVENSHFWIFSCRTALIELRGSHGLADSEAVISPDMPHNVVVVAMPGWGPLDFGIALYSFGFAPYRLTVCGEAPAQELLAHSVLTPTVGLEALHDADTVIVPGYNPTENHPPSSAILRALRGAYDRGARIVSNSTAAFTLGYAGLLDGREVTTHWLHLDELAEAFPRCVVRREVIYITDGQLSSSAGGAAGIDLFLDMIRTDLGAAVANQRRRRLIAAPLRAGEQRQYFELETPHPTEDAVLAVRAWSLNRLEEQLTLADMAAQANMSIRNFSRRFTAETGNTPMKWLQAARIDYARELLETTDKNITEIARRVGMGSRANFRRIFVTHVGVAPNDYRTLHAENQHVTSLHDASAHLSHIELIASSPDGMPA